MGTREIASTSANYTIGDVLYASSITQLSTLAIGSAGNLFATKSGIPSWIGGSSGSETAYTAGTPLVSIYATSANTSSTNAEPFYVKSIMTGVGGYGGRARFHAYTNVALGSNFQALKAYAEFGSSGSCAGLSAGFCAELKTPNATITGGNYYVQELEYVAGGTSTTTNPQASQAGFIYMAQSGDTDGDFDDKGYLFRLDGCTVGSGHLFQTNTAGNATHALRINIGGTNYYIMLTSTGA